MMKRGATTWAAAAACAILAAAPAAAGDGKGGEALRKKPAAESAVLATFQNGTGDGSVKLSTDGYGSFGSTTPAGDVAYDPAGEIGPKGAVWESALFFGPLQNFLSSGDFHTGANLPPVTVKATKANVYVSSFTVSGFAFKLTQWLLPATATGSTFTQTYEITNTTGSDQSVVVGRYMEGDLYFAGSFGNDFGAVSVDNETLYQFDDGDDPKAPATFVGITGTGGAASGFTVQPYRFSDDVIAAGGVPANVNGKVYNDTDNDGVSNAGFDAGLYKQNTLTIPAGRTVVYKTSTIFGDGSIASAAADVAGCLKLASLPLANRAVTVTQADAADRKTTTDAGGCFRVDGLTKGKTFKVIVSGPKVPAD